MASYVSGFAFLGSIAIVVFLLFNAVYTYTDNIGRIIIEMILALLSFFGLFWNLYFTVSSIFKCFIPSKAFLTNTKYCSIIPETKSPEADWLDVTIQIPVYKESLVDVLMPTLRSCAASRDYYEKCTNKCCNIVVCDDGMMALLRDNFPAAEMLWENIVKTHGRKLKLSKLLANVPRASRQHLKGLKSKHVYEVFHRMLYYYHHDIGFVARSMVDRRGKFKKASNLNGHLRLSLGAQQTVEQAGGDRSVTFEEALIEEVHNEDGSRFIMFGNNIRIGHLICVNDADARMAEKVILKTVPEFLNDKSLGFTQHTTKTMSEQRNESYFTRMLGVYTDALYQGHFLLSSILGCHPPLVGHSIFLRTEAVKQCGRVRTLRKAQQWLERIGLHFLPVDQVGFANLQAENRIEYWSESHVSEDFELMIHLYSLGFNGRYCAYPDCEFQEGITRTFDEEAGRHRKFALGAHELVFNPFQEMMSHGIFTPIFRTFVTCDIPSYYKIFLTAYLSSYAAGGAYVIVFTIAAIMRIFDGDGAFDFISAFNPASVIILNFIVYFVIGYITFLISLCRMGSINERLLFPEYRKKYFRACRLVYVKLRYSFTFQFLFYNVTAFTFYFLGSMDHLLSRRSIVTATNKDSINSGRCRAFGDMVDFNCGSWLVAFTIAALGYATIVQEKDWDITDYPDEYDEYLQHGIFAGPPIFLAILAFVVPIILNPWVLGWPFLPRKKAKVQRKKLPQHLVGDLPTMMKMRKAEELDSAIMETTKEEMDDDDDLQSFNTNDLKTQSSPQHSVRRIDPSFIATKEKEYRRQMELARPTVEEYNNQYDETYADTLSSRPHSLHSIETTKAVSRGKPSLENSRNVSREASLERSRHNSEGKDQRINRSWTAGTSKSPPVNAPANGVSVSWEEARPGRSPSQIRGDRSSASSRSPSRGRSVNSSRSSRTKSPGTTGTQKRMVSPPQSPRRDQWGFPMSK